MDNGKYPRQVSDFADLESAVEEFVLPGFLPPAPIIARGMVVRT